MVNVDNVYQGEGNEKYRERLCSFSKDLGNSEDAKTPQGARLF